VLAHDFRRARFDREAWTVVVKRTRPLAAGIAYYRGEAGGRAVQLDGRGAGPSRGDGTLRHRWRIVRRPSGSRARLVRPTSQTPRLPIDVRGRYTLTERITEHGGGPTRTTSHRVTVLGDTNALPLGASVKVSLEPESGAGSITIDDAPSAGLPASDCTKPGPAGARRCVYPLPDAWMQTYMLVLDAVTLEPKGPVATVGSCPTDTQFEAALHDWEDKNVIAILTSQAGGSVCKGRTSTVASIAAPFTYIFTPTSKPDLGIRSGWYSEAGIDDPRPAEVEGFFQKSWPVGDPHASDQYRFVPGGYVGFDTSKGGDPAGQNTMVVADKQYTSALPGGATDGFQVLVLDKELAPMLGTPAAFRTTAGGTATDGTGLWDMSNLLQKARATPGVSTVLVQSIGRPTPNAPAAPNAWNAVATQLGQLGASPDVILNLKASSWPLPDGATGWYSFAAAPDPACAPSSKEPCASAVEASTSLTERDGDVSGVLARNNVWQYAPVLNEAGGEANDDMLSLAYQAPTKWPYSEDAYRPVLDYLANYRDDARDLHNLGSGDCYDPGPRKDVRSSYCNIYTNWGRIHDDLANWVCQRYPGATTVGVDETTYKSVCNRIALETQWLDDVSKAMLGLKDNTLGEPQLTAYLAVEDMAAKVKAAIEAGQAKADRKMPGDLLSLIGESVEWYSLFGPEPIGAVGEFLGGAMLLAGEITSLVEGDGQGDSAFSEPVLLDPGEVAQELQDRLSAAGAAFDHSWDMLISDPAKLETAWNRFELPSGGPGTDDGIWRKVPDDLDTAQPIMRDGIRHWAAGRFMAATYDVWLVDTTQIAGPQARDVTTADVHTIGCDRQNHYGNTSTWPPFYKMPQSAAYYLRDQLGLTVWKYPDHIPRYGSDIWVLGRGTVSTKNTSQAQFWPPQKLLDQLFSPPSEGGFGWERPWLFSRGQRFTIHDPAWTTDPARLLGGRCDWFAQDRYPYEG
jgi:hypothetical protein